MTQAGHSSQRFNEERALGSSLRYLLVSKMQDPNRSTLRPTVYVSFGLSELSPRPLHVPPAELLRRDGEKERRREGEGRAQSRGRSQCAEVASCVLRPGRAFELFVGPSSGAAVSSSPRQQPSATTSTCSLGDMRNALAPLDDNQGSRYVPAHQRGKDPARRQSQGGNRTQLHGRPALPVARWEELRGGKSFAAQLCAKGPDGTRGFAAGRGKPLCPAATPALQRGRAIFGTADDESMLQPCDPPLAETPVAPHNHVSIFGAADHESVLQSPAVETPAAPQQNHESIFDLLQSPNDPSFVETPVAAQNESKPRRLLAPQQNEPKFHRLPPGLGMTPRMVKPVVKPVADPVVAEKKEAAEVEMDAMETALETTLARARQASSRARELNAALLACRYDEEDVTAPEAAAAP